MKKEEFFEVLGELDDDLVSGARTAMRRKMSWRAWGALAACLALVLSFGVFCWRQGGGDEPEPGIADVAPMVYVQDTLYIQSSDQQGYPECKEEFLYLGKITSDCADGAPKENFQANHPIVGCKVYQYGENIVVKIQDAYWLYMKYGGPEVTWDNLTEPEKGRLDSAYRGPQE